MSNPNEKIVVNSSDFRGNVHTSLYDGICPYSNKTESDYLAESFSVMTVEEFKPILEKYLDGLCGQWQEISEQDYNDALDALPPLRWTNGGFYFLERYTADVTSFYQEWYGKFYTSMQRLSYKREDVINSLEAFIKEGSIAK